MLSYLCLERILVVIVSSQMHPTIKQKISQLRRTGDTSLSEVIVFDIRYIYPFIYIAFRPPKEGFNTLSQADVNILHIGKSIGVQGSKRP